jgi:hypothetical protein
MQETGDGLYSGSSTLCICRETGCLAPVAGLYLGTLFSQPIFASQLHFRDDEYIKYLRCCNHHDVRRFVLYNQPAMSMLPSDAPLSGFSTWSAPGSAPPQIIGLACPVNGCNRWYGGTISWRKARFAREHKEKILFGTRSLLFAMTSFRSNFVSDN